MIVSAPEADWPQRLRRAPRPHRDRGATAMVRFYRRPPPNPGARPLIEMAARGASLLAKNASTLWREAQVVVGDGGPVVDAADPLEVIEQVMRYFHGLGVHGAKSKAPIEQVQKCFNRALHAASIAAPYRHARLSAVKHIDNADTIVGISANATPEELRAEIAKRVALLRDKGYLDMDALPAPPDEPAPDDDELLEK